MSEEKEQANDGDDDDEPLYEIRTSPIHGRGLYARELIEKDTWIVQYLGEHIDKTESDRRSTALLEKAKLDGSARVYMFILNDTTDIDGNVEWNDARLINHSCEPNVEAQIWEDKEIWFIATKDIQPGEELFYNYGFDLDTWEEHPCCCGSKKCIGYIVEEELWPQLRRKIAAKKAWETRRRKLEEKKRNEAMVTMTAAA
jgi:SET domain-containing protein